MNDRLVLVQPLVVFPERLFVLSAIQKPLVEIAMPLMPLAERQLVLAELLQMLGLTLHAQPLLRLVEQPLVHERPLM